jgi:hypothetical protein
MGDHLGTDRAGGSPDGFRGELPSHIERWVRASLITPQQAEGIWNLEGGAPAARRIPLVTEALGYLGLLLIAGALFAVLGKLQVSLRTLEMVLGGLVVLLFVGGWMLRAAEEPALSRLAGIQWLLSVAALVALVATVCIDLSPGNTVDTPHRGELMWTAMGVAAVVYAFPLYLRRRTVAQILALFVATAIAATAIVVLVFPGTSNVVGAVAAWALGIVWLILALRRSVGPTRMALALASLTIAIAPLYVSAGDHIPAAIALGIASTAGLMAASVVWRQTTLLFAGSAGLFVYVAWFIGRYLSDALGLPLALLLGGVALLALAVLAARLRKSTG